MESPNFPSTSKKDSERVKSPSFISQSIKDLSFAMFMGSVLDAKYKNIIIADRNSKIIEFFSRPISQVNKPYFKQKMVENLNEEVIFNIKEIADNKEPYVDSYGRVTFFYVLAGGQIVPVYQPGTIMFESAVNEKADIAVLQDGVHQNGPVLDCKAALFLAKFLS